MIIHFTYLSDCTILMTTHLANSPPTKPAPISRKISAASKNAKRFSTFCRSISPTSRPTCSKARSLTNRMISPTEDMNSEISRDLSEFRKYPKTMKEELKISVYSLSLFSIMSKCLFYWTQVIRNPKPKPVMFSHKH